MHLSIHLFYCFQSSVRFPFMSQMFFKARFPLPCWKRCHPSSIDPIRTDTQHFIRAQVKTAPSASWAGLTVNFTGHVRHGRLCYYGNYYLHTILGKHKIINFWILIHSAPKEQRLVIFSVVPGLDRDSLNSLCLVLFNYWMFLIQLWVHKVVLLLLECDSQSQHIIDIVKAHFLDSFGFT